MEKDAFEEDIGDQKSNDNTRRLRRMLDSNKESEQLKDDEKSIEEADEEDGPLISHQTE